MGLLLMGLVGETSRFGTDLDAWRLPIAHAGLARPAGLSMIGGDEPRPGRPWMAVDDWGTRCLRR